MMPRLSIYLLSGPGLPLEVEVCHMATISISDEAALFKDYNQVR